MDALRTFADTPWIVIAWAVLTIPSLTILIRDLKVRNSHLMSMMKLVWGFTVLSSGLLGLAIYWITGRKEIPDDTTWRRAFRSVAHCYSGCGLGEIVGLGITVGLFQAGNTATSIVTFCCAYLFGMILTVAPEVQAGTPLPHAFTDALKAETPSIAVMEIVAIGVDLLLAGSAGPGSWIFWSSMLISLSCGLLAAWPVNLLLIRNGVKDGMMDPRMTHHAHGSSHHHHAAHHHG